METASETCEGNDWIDSSIGKFTCGDIERMSKQYVFLFTGNNSTEFLPVLIPTTFLKRIFFIFLSNIKRQRERIEQEKSFYLIQITVDYNQIRCIKKNCSGGHESIFLIKY